jgi:flagellar M-ring protein FliF
MPLGDVAKQFGGFWSALPTVKKLVLAMLVIGAAVGFTLLMTWSGSVRFRPLVSNLPPDEAGEVLAFLKNQQIPYEISAAGDTISVPVERYAECRLDLASRGLPQGGGVGFEVFDNAKIGMTEFVQNVNYQRALQGELARTIGRISEVESARVHIVLPEQSLFLETQQPATASVVLKVRRGQWLSEDQVRGIVHLVSSSVARLKPENVTVVDQNGKLLAGQDGGTPMQQLSSNQLEYQETMERSLENRVKSMLDKALGHDKAVVRISCDIDFRQQEMTEEQFYPENRVVRSEQVLSEKSGQPTTAPLGVPGLRTNIEPGDEQNRDTERSEFEKQDRTVNYEIGRRTSHIVEPAAKLQRVSAAVIVDGSYQPMEKGEAVGWKYVPRSESEMHQLESLVKRAINFDEQRGDRVEVVNIPFETQKLLGAEQAPPQAGWLDQVRPMAGFIKYALLALFLLLLFFFVVRPIVRWLTESVAGDGQLLTQLPKTVGEIESESGNAGYRQELDRLLTSNSDAAANVMQDWIKESS